MAKDLRLRSDLSALCTAAKTTEDLLGVIYKPRLCFWEHFARITLTVVFSTSGELDLKLLYLHLLSV